jgi:hypothetical protein
MLADYLWRDTKGTEVHPAFEVILEKAQQAEFLTPVIFLL